MLKSISEIKLTRSARIGGVRSTRRAFTLIEIMIVVLIIGVLLAIAAPNFAKARETTRAKACIGNLRRIQYAKDAYMMLNNKPGTTPAAEFTDAALYGTGRYVDIVPQCPGGGTYSPNDGNLLPQCTLAATYGHTLE